MTAHRAAWVAGLVLGALVLDLPVAAAATPGKITKEAFTFGEQRVTYCLFVPKNVSAPASAPLIVLLHGSGRNGSTLVESWKSFAEKEGIVLVGPDAQNPQSWHVPADGPAPLCGLVDDLRKTLPVINPRRVYLFGHSAGAVFVLYMSMLESEYFAAGALHAGAWRSPAEFTSIQAAVRKIPLAITVGDNDRFFPLADGNATADALKKAGMPVQLEIIKNHDHNYYVMSDRVNAWAWAALKNHVLESDPKYSHHQFQ
jgi:poly(3-hydroxybutyrate) depolymerase